MYLLYHQQAMTWGWYMLEPWEALLWFACLGLLAYLVLSACFANGQSICHTTLVAVRNSLAARGEGQRACACAGSGHAGLLGCRLRDAAASGCKQQCSCAAE